MLVCNAAHCVMPARCQPSVLTLPAKHWGDKGVLIPLGVCFCEKHKILASLEVLFTDPARRGLDVQFMKENRPIPDWSRCELRWEIVDPRAKSLFTFAIYENPSDYPGKFVVRRWATQTPNFLKQLLVAVEDSLEAARSKLPEGLACLTRSPSDDPAIVEVWL